MNAKPRLVCAALVLALAAIPAEAGDRVERTLKLVPGGRLFVEVDSGQVAVMGSTDSGAAVVVTSKTQDLEERWALAFEETPGQVRVTSKRKGSGGGTLLGWLTGSASNNAPKFEIRVPRETQVSVRTAGGSVQLAALEGAATLETAGGSIKVSDVTGDTTVSTAGGSIDVSKLEGDLSATTAGGSVRVSGVTGNARVETAGGSISVEGVGGHVQAATAGGSIDAGLESGNPRGGRLETSGGSIRVRIDPAANFLLQASSSGGTVSTEVPLSSVTRKTRTSLEGTLGKGGEQLVLESSGGSVRIEPLQAPR